ncbi:MAG: TonB-dependent receptor [Bryobacterales bacterium]|nr:TonB-dependent receptor [Bryobacterales bacterium]
MTRPNGAPGNTSSFRIEGQDASNGYVNAVPAQVQPGVDSIQEVTIQTSNFAAEYGQVGGGFFNYTMKSGTNQLHGSLYDYFVNEALDAGIPWTVSPTNANQHLRTVERRNDYGFTIGGPVVIPKLYNGHDKTFLFFNWEQFREFKTINGQADTVPTVAYRNGNFQTALTGRNLCPTATPNCDPIGRPIMEGTVYDPSTQRLAPNGQIIRDPFPNNIIPPIDMDPVALKIQALIPLPNVAGGGLVNNGIYPYRSDRVTGIPSFKIDQIISPKDKVSFYFSEIYTGSAYSNTTGGADGLPEPITQAIGTFITSHMYRLNYERTLSPTLLLHFGAGYQDEYFADDKVVTDYNAATQLGLVGATVPRMFPAIGAASNAQGGVKQLSSGTNRHIWYQKPTSNTSLTWVKDNHTFKFGGEARFEGVPTTLFSDTNGVYTFSPNETGLPSTQGQSLQGGTVGMPYASFLLGLVDGVAVAYPPTLKLAKQQWGAFAQDTWKISRKLTVDYGLRYDFGTYPKEEHGVIPNFSATTPNPSAGGRLGAVAFEGDGIGRCNCEFAHNYSFAFGPRLGAAYQINSKTVFRVGLGVVYNTTPGNNGATANIPNPVNVTSPSFGQAVMTLRTGIPFAATPWPNFNPGQFPVPGTLGAPKVDIDPNAGRPARQIQWSVGLQRSIGKDLAVEAAYVANRGVWWNAPALVDANALTPQILASVGLDIDNAADRTLLASPLNSATAIARGFSTRIPYAGFPLTSTVAQSLRPFPQFTSVQALWSPLGKTWYDSLRAKVTKRLSHGLSATSVFTWSRSLTLGQNLDPGNLSLGNGVINDVFNRNNNKYLSDFDQPLQLNTSLTYITPKAQLGNSLAGKAASWVSRDWTVAAYAGYASGMPIEAPYAQNALNTLFLRNVSSPTSVDGYISAGQPPAQATFATRVPGQPL